ncbi:MAG: hydrogenase accessory protein HypB, partial [Magnetospirillum sp.]|nr:hydrogenase accessory protein HypB [Magnetospirillum sp.]
KVDLLPHLDFDVAKCVDYARRVNPDIVVLQVSAKTGQGLDEWLAWVAEGRRQAIAERIKMLEAKLAAAKANLG